VLAAGCRTPPWELGDSGSPRDLGVADLAVRDLAVRDLAVRDFAVRDLAVRDLAVRDLAVRDLTTFDLAGADLRRPPGEVCVSNNDSTIEAFDALQDGDGPPLRSFGRLTKLDYPVAVAVDAVHDEIVVANLSTRAITVYGRAASGVIAPLRRIAGPATGLNPPMGVGAPYGIAVDPTNNEIWVSVADWLLVFARTADGNVAPLRTFSVGPLDGGIDFRSTPSIAVDAVHDEIVLASFGFFVGVYSRTATSGAAPLRVLWDRSTPLYEAAGVAVDPVHDEILVAGSSGGRGIVAAYSRTANGDSTPLRTFSGSSLGQKIALDLAHDEILSLGGTAITVYPRTAVGSVAPSRTLSGLGTSSYELSMAVDATHGEIVVSDPTQNRVAVYARAATGNAAPLRILTAGQLSGVQTPYGIAYDPAHDEILVSNFLEYSVTAYPRSANGDVRPLRRFTANVGIFQGLAFDPAHDEIFLTTFGYAQDGSTQSGIAVFPRTANGAVTPSRTISGAALKNSRAYGVAVDTVHDEVVIASWANPGLVAVYPRAADGQLAPLRKISGSATGISQPSAVAVDSVNDEIVVAGYSGVAIHARTADGNATPLRTIVWSGLHPSGLALDVAHDEIFTVNDAVSGGGVKVFSRTASGMVAPLRTIAGPATRIWQDPGSSSWQPAQITLCN
jgi:hypothetical protein